MATGERGENHAVGNVTAVTISKEPLTIRANLPFYCHTDGYRRILHHDNCDRERVDYITSRYSDAVNIALEQFPETEDILIIDTYYVDQPGIPELVSTYSTKKRVIMGASIWCWIDSSHWWRWIRYYESLSNTEFAGRKWWYESSLPRGLWNVGAVGACWIFPRRLWQGSFKILKGALVNSSCIENKDCQVVLNCDVKLWRTPADNSEMPDYGFLKRLRYSLEHSIPHFSKRLVKTEKQDA